MTELEADKMVIDEIRSFVGLTEEQVRSVFRAFSSFYAIGNYSSDQEIHLPYFGSFKLIYEGEETTKDFKRVAKVTGLFALHDNIIKDIGIVEDMKSGDPKEIKNLGAYQNVRKDMKNTLTIKE